MNLNTEIRKLNPGNLFNLVQILEQDESWKKLMAIIPKTLTLDNYDCKITINNLPKYNTDHFKLIDSAGYKQRRPCAEILLEEWGTSGRIRPRLGHLIYLLKKTELFRAADFVAMHLLRMPEVDRPSSGPAAKIDIPKDEQLNNYIPQESISYPSSLLEADPISSSIIDELMNTKQKHVIPEIRIIGVNETQEQHQKKITESQRNNNIPNFSELLLLENSDSPLIPTSRNNSNSENSQISSISSNNVISNTTEITNISNEHSVNLPDLSKILNNSTDDKNVNSQDYIPAISNLLDSRNLSSNIPAISQILDSNNENISQNSQNDLPAFSQMLEHNTEIIHEHKTQNIPAFSQILNENSQNFSAENSHSDELTPAFSQILEKSPVNSQNLPAFSQIGYESSQELSKSENTPNDFSPAFSQLLDGSPITNNPELNQNVPAFSQILNSSPAVSEVSSTEIPGNISPNLGIPDLNLLASSLHSSSRSCVSPLPNLELNTILPHFTYQELEVCTQNFDESLLSMQESTNLNQAARFGRKLGSGAFGSVYLGIGLLDKPVAVKKLNLNGVVVVNVNDTITKQFRNEVELLCKYKHENLLSLLGYSCDGPTYCLIYEYICGGALKDRLQSSLKNPELFRLLWTDRLYIALGTAKAVAYLHNAYSMPLIHRDIKSANILLDGNNKPKLCDFGLIKLTPNQNTNTSTTVFGTSAYMAPEAFRGDVSVKLDTFSFGVVLLELLTSLPPLDESREGNDLVTHVEEICEDDIKPLLDMNAGSWLVDKTHFGDEIYKIANQCLEEKKRRPLMTVVVSQLTELINKSIPEFYSNK